MSNKAINSMFKHEGKTVNIMGKTRVKTYQELYMRLSQLQKEKEIPVHGDYLGDNELAQNIYKKKYFLKDLDNELIEKTPEDVFKRLSAFIATVEGTKVKQKQWSKKF
ncbi:uncharacterized protein METZ01_LOCUS236182, partial [marine metagenome]